MPNLLCEYDHFQAKLLLNKNLWASFFSFVTFSFLSMQTQDNGIVFHAIKFINNCLFCGVSHCLLDNLSYFSF